MKKFGLLLIGGIATIVLLANLGPLIGLAITVGIGYLVIREFVKARTTGASPAHVQFEEMEYYLNRLGNQVNTN